MPKIKGELYPRLHVPAPHKPLKEGEPCYDPATKKWGLLVKVKGTDELVGDYEEKPEIIQTIRKKTG